MAGQHGRFVVEQKSLLYEIFASRDTLFLRISILKIANIMYIPTIILIIDKE